MQKPIMIKYILAITLSFFCLLFSSPAEARLTLGAVPADGQVAGAATAEKINAIAAALAGRLGEEITVKEMVDSDALVNWLDRFSSLDLALFTTQDVNNYRGRFLMVGPLDAGGSLNLVARQGVTSDLLARLSGFVSESGFMPGRPLVASVTGKEPPVASRPIVPEPPKRDAKVEGISRDPQEKTPPLDRGRAWLPEDSSSLPDILPPDKPQAQKLVLGVVPDATGVVHNGQQAELLAAYLESTLPVDVTVREFKKVETFAAWFRRYRMVDIAVISSDLAALNLGRDYLPIIKLLRSDKPGEDSAELVVVRHDQDSALQELLQQTILDAPTVPDGKDMMTALHLSEVFVPGMRLTGREVVEQRTGQEAVPVPELPQIAKVTEPEIATPAPEVPKVAPVPAKPVDEPSEPVADVIADTILETPEPDYPEPEKPVPPADISVVDIHKPEMAVGPSPVPPMPVVPKLAPALPAPSVAPAVPAQPTDTASVETPAPVMAKPFSPAPPDAPVVVVVPVPVSPEEESGTSEASVEKDVEVEEGASAPEEVLVQETSIIEEVLTFAEPVPSHELGKQIYMVPAEDAEPLMEEDLLAMLGEDPVAAMVAQPDLPQELRPTGVPVVRPRPTPQKTAEAVEKLLVASIPEPLRRVEPEQLPVLLPQPDPEPGIVYVVPFVSVMVPGEVSSRIFDQFIDSLNEQGEALGLQFLILKEGLQRVDPEWLVIRKYVTGEIYAYVEDSGCCSTDLRSKARLTYRHPHKQEPVFGFEYPVRNFFDHDRSTLEIERAKMADDVAKKLADELILALRN